MKGFLTSYSCGGHTYGAYIQAGSAAQARQLALARGLNETVVGEPEHLALPHRLAQLIREERWVEAAHEACFLGFVGLSSGALSARELLGDTGLLHELIHLAAPSIPTEQLSPDPEIAAMLAAEDAVERQATIESVVRMARDFEYRVPGHMPSFKRAHEEREAAGG